MKKTVLISAIVATLGLGTLATNSFADGYEGKKCGGKGLRSMMHYGHSIADRLEEPLQLTKEQVTKIDEITDAQYKQMRDSKREKRDLYGAIAELDPTSPDYDAEVDKLAQQAGERVEQMIQSRAEVRQQIAAVLTPEQQEKMKTLKSEMKEKWEGHRRGHHGNDE